MAIQNRDAPAVIRAEDFDPGKMGPGEILIVEEAGERHAYIGLSAGEPVRIATHAELKSFGNDARLAANEAADARAVIAVQVQEATRLQERAQQAVQRAEQALEAAERAEAAARSAAEAMEAVNAAIAGMGASISASIGSVLTATKGGGA